MNTHSHHTPAGRMTSGRSPHERRSASLRNPARLPAIDADGLPLSRGTADTPSGTDAGLFSRCFGSALFAWPFAALVGLLLITVSAAAALCDPDPTRLVTPLALSSLGLTALTAGFIAERRAGCAPVLAGLLSGLIFTGSLFLLSFLVDGHTRTGVLMEISTLTRVGLHTGVVLVSLLGACLGRPPKKRPAHTERHRHAPH